LVGTIFLVEYDFLSDDFTLIFAFLGLAFATAHCLLRRNRDPVMVGLLGTSAAFFTAAAVTFPLQGFTAIAAISLPYALI
jgi:membrane associated rhomboid family serine protease